jgi:hypothetical protein
MNVEIISAKMLANGERLAVHVLKNEEVKYLVEDNKEGLIMMVREFMTLTKQGGDVSSVESWLMKLGTSTNSIVGQVMNHAETLDYLMSLHRFDPLFAYKRVYSARWVKKTLHDVSGGVRIDLYVMDCVY